MLTILGADFDAYIYMLIITTYSCEYIYAIINMGKLSSNIKLNESQIDFNLNEQLKYNDGNISGLVYI